MIEKKMLFSPGPVLTSQGVRQSLVHPDMCHRRPVFEDVLRRVRRNLVEIANGDDDYVAVVVSGSGTAANETALSSIIKTGEQVLLIKNGEFGERLHEILDCYHIPMHLLDLPWGEAPQPSAVRQALEANPAIAWVCLVYHETSTGMRNPLPEIGAVVAACRRKLFVDCVSAFGGEELDLRRYHIDACSGVPNKAVGGLPGVSFVIARRSSLPGTGEWPRRNVYLDLQKHIAMADKCEQTPNTPSVTMIVALDQALLELLERGMPAQLARYRQCAGLIRQGVRQLGLRLMLPDELCSNTVTSVFLPDGMHVDALIDALDQRGYVVYPGKRHLYEQNMFQIANMGMIQPQDCLDFLAVLRETLAQLSPEWAHAALAAQTSHAPAG